MRAMRNIYYRFIVLLLLRTQLLVAQENGAAIIDIYGVASATGKKSFLKNKLIIQ